MHCSRLVFCSHLLILCMSYGQFLAQIWSLAEVIEIRSFHIGTQGFFWIYHSKFSFWIYHCPSFSFIFNSFIFLIFFLLSREEKEGERQFRLVSIFCSVFDHHKRKIGLKERPHCLFYSVLFPLGMCFGIAWEENAAHPTRSSCKQKALNYEWEVEILVEFTKCTEL